MDTPVFPDPQALQRLVDQDAIRTLQARFDDAVIRRDITSFRSLWAAEAVWEIDPPLKLHAEGVDEILKALAAFDTLNEFFFRTTGYGVITLDGDKARATVPTTEFGRRGEGKIYGNVALYQDELVRQDGAWVFSARRYYYLWLDTDSPMPGQVVPLPLLPVP